MSNLEVNAELTNLTADALVTLYVLDATEIGGELLFFYPGTDDNHGSVLWQGNLYVALPMEAAGFEYKGEGSPPRPSITFGNVAGMFSGLVLAFDDMIGAKLVRKRTFARYLDGQPTADPTQALPDEVFFFERKATENKFAVQFELGTTLDIEDTSLPARVIHSNLCAWIYRGDGCGYVGVPKADVFDAAPGIPITAGVPELWSAAATYHVGDYVYRMTSRGVRRYAWCIADNAGAGITGIGASPANPTFWKAEDCSRRISGCDLRFGATGFGLPFGAFASANRLSG